MYDPAPDIGSAWLKAGELLAAEAARAAKYYPEFNSLMEAEAVLREEMDELTTELRKAYNPSHPMTLSPEARHELIHLGGMCARLLVEQD